MRRVINPRRKTPCFSTGDMRRVPWMAAGVGRSLPNFLLDSLRRIYYPVKQGTETRLQVPHVPNGRAKADACSHFRLLSLHLQLGFAPEDRRLLSRAPTPVLQGPLRGRKKHSGGGTGRGCLWRVGKTRGGESQPWHDSTKQESLSVTRGIPQLGAWGGSQFDTPSTLHI